ESEGIELVRGTGRLAGEREVEVEQLDGSRRRLSARKAVVMACGTTPAVPPIDGLRDIAYWTNRDATAAKEVPRRFLVLGGGPIGIELAQAFRRLGSEEVTVIEGSPRVLARDEPFAGEEVREAFEAEGITVITGMHVTAVRREGDGPVTATLEDGRELTGDEILVAVGRRPKTADIGVERFGLEPGTFLDVDERIRVNGVQGEWLYAVG